MTNFSWNKLLLALASLSAERGFANSSKTNLKRVTNNDTKNQSICFPLSCRQEVLRCVSALSKSASPSQHESLRRTLSKSVCVFVCMCVCECVVSLVEKREGLLIRAAGWAERPVIFIADWILFLHTVQMSSAETRNNSNSTTGHEKIWRPAPTGAVWCPAELHLHANDASSEGWKAAKRLKCDYPGL